MESDPSTWLDRYDYWFAPLLRHRSATFRRMFEHVLARNPPYYIIETGCIQRLGNWGGDGQSTVLFDDLISRVDGQFWSVDIDPSAVEVSRSVTGPRSS